MENTKDQLGLWIVVGVRNDGAAGCARFLANGEQCAIQQFEEIYSDKYKIVGALLEEALAPKG